MEIISDKTGFSPIDNPGRVNQQKMLPTAVPTRILGQIIGGNPESLGVGSGSSITVTVPNGQSRTIVTTLTDNFGRVVLAVPDETFYIGSISATNQYPNASYNMTNMPVSYWNDWGTTDNVNAVHKASIYNNTGGSLDVVYVIRWRIITNPVAGNTGSNT